MELNENNSLVALEYLLQEFFNYETNNNRKHEIEQQLESFKLLPDLPKLCLYYLTNTSSQYVTMFALSNLETVINQQWINLEWALREEIKQILHNFLIEKGVEAPHFIRCKYTKLLVAIAKQDWPSRDPNFFNNILELLKSEPNQLIGLLLLKTMSEEFMGAQCSFENGRKIEVTRLLHQYIPIVFEIMTSILEKLGSKPKHMTTATPPPSPTHPSTAPIVPLAMASFKADHKLLCKEALETVQHLFTWVPIELIPPNIIKAIFSFTTIPSIVDQEDEDSSINPINVINELLYRKCTPPGSQQFFIQLYLHSLELLREIIAQSATYTIQPLDPQFVEKLAEMLILIIENHLWRLEMEPGFNALDLLSLLYQLIIQLWSVEHWVSIESYLKLISVWNAFFKQMKPEKCQQYSGAFLELLKLLVKNIQFTLNFTQLKFINQYDANDDDETDWDIFLKTSIEFIVKIAEHAPLETLNQVLVPWNNCYNSYRRLETIVDRQNCLLKCDYQESRDIYNFLIDFSSLTQTLARLSQYFLDPGDEEVGKTVTPIIGDFIKKTVESASLATSIRFYNLECPSQDFHFLFRYNHSHLLAALKTVLPWITQPSDIDPLSLILDFTLPLIDERVPFQIGNSAAQLFLAITAIPFSPNFILLPNITHFIAIVTNLKLREETKLITFSAITNLLIKSWDESNVEKLQHRDRLANVFFDTLTSDFRCLTINNYNCERTEEVVKKTLPVLSHIVDFSKDFTIVCKKKLYLYLSSTIEHSILLFPNYVHCQAISNCILIFFLNVLRVLQQQLGVEPTKKAVEIFLEVAVKEQETGNFLDKLLQIFQLVVECPGSNYKSFLPGILQLCMDNVYPYILSNRKKNTDAFIALLTLLHSILLHRWQYFHSSQVRLGYSPVYNEPEGDPQEPTQLLMVLQVFGQALMHDDLNIFKLSLQALEDLNAKWKLYLSVLYRYQQLSKYLNVLLSNLLEKSQMLHTEDVQIAIFNMASVNFKFFFTTFLPEFIQNLNGLNNEQKEVLLRNFVQNHDKDMPTFIQHLKIFVNDAQHYRLCSGTLPSAFV